MLLDLRWIQKKNKVESLSSHTHWIASLTHWMELKHRTLLMFHFMKSLMYSFEHSMTQGACSGLLKSFSQLSDCLYFILDLMCLVKFLYGDNIIDKKLSPSKVCCTKGIGSRRPLDASANLFHVYILNLAFHALSDKELWQSSSVAKLIGFTC